MSHAVTGLGFGDDKRDMSKGGDLSQLLFVTSVGRSKRRYVYSLPFLSLQKTTHLEVGVNAAQKKSNI